MKKSLSPEYSKMTLEVPFIMKKGKSGFVAECVDLNIVTQGQTLKETKKNVAEARRLHLKSANELGILDGEFEKLSFYRNI
ncbi:type II toxin-antitoxin system HicB family antitoxin [Candidatus Pacearchaeota archaeon]|nr:type II toxin-antitoxin system HicB family antitoxin [Candidatus Pacearchaeota archaeon]